MNHDMQIGDIVRIKTDGDLLRQPHGLTSRMSARPESEGQIGVIVAMAKQASSMCKFPRVLTGLQLRPTSPSPSPRVGRGHTVNRPRQQFGTFSGSRSARAHEPQGNAGAL